MSAALMLATYISGAVEAAPALFDNASKDSLFVLYFPEEPLADDDSDGEAWNDMQYHVGEALPEKYPWRFVEIARRKSPAAWKRYNPRGNLMFQMRYRGKEVLRSTLTNSDRLILTRSQ